MLPCMCKTWVLFPITEQDKKKRERENRKKTCHKTEKGRKVNQGITFVVHKHSSVDLFNHMPLINIYFHSFILGLHGLKPKAKKTKNFWNFAGTQDPSSWSVQYIHVYSVSRQVWSTPILSFKSQNQSGGWNSSIE